MSAHRTNILIRRTSAGTYVPPMLVIFAGTCVFLQMAYIVPSFEKLFADFGTELPATTKMIMNFSRWLGGRLTPDQLVPGYVWVVPCVLALVVFQVRRFFMQRDEVDERSLKHWALWFFWMSIGLGLTALSMFIIVALTVPVVRPYRCSLT